MHDLNHREKFHLILGAPLMWAAVIMLILMATACLPSISQTTTPLPFHNSTEEAISTAVQITPTPSPTPIPQGTEGNPIVMGIVWSDEATQSGPAAQFIQYLADTTGFVFALQPFSSKMDLLTSMDQGKVSFAWLQPEEYLYASENNIASAAFITSHYGLFAYGSSVYVRSDSSFRLYFDEDTGSSESPASTALRQFSKKVPCLVNQRSISGYAYPLGLLADVNVIVKDPLLLQTHESVIRAIYTGGICDFGFTYGISGDPRTSSSIQADMPDIMDKVKIAWQSPADIPSLNLSFATLLAGDIRYAISTALASYALNPSGLQTLSQMNNYAIDGIRQASDADYEILRTVLRAASIDVVNLISQ